MAVSSGTFTVKRDQLSNNVALISMNMSATGDGSGGDIDIGQDISGYLPQKCRCWIEYAFIKNDDASGRDAAITSSSAYWSALTNDTIIANSTTQELLSNDGTTKWYTTSQGSYVHPPPIYLGSPLTAPFLKFAAVTNTNGKTWAFGIRLKVESLP